MPKYFFQDNILEKRLSKKGQNFSGIALFLDFDGTLVPIQKHPSLCIPKPEIKMLLSELAGSGHIFMSIISGRTVHDVKRRVGIKGIHYAGNHGLQISGPHIQFTHPAAREGEKVLTRAARSINKVLPAFEGAWLEDKKYTLAVHFRDVRMESVNPLIGTVHKVISRHLMYGQLHVHGGKKILELAPAVAWNKGMAAHMILGQVGNGWLPVVIGDDITDESAFEALRETGVSIRVGRSRNTAAEFYLRNQGEVARVLKEIAGLFY